MNKKGFVFIETIVMCAVLMVALLIIYNSYTSAIVREKERLNYNTIEGQYRLIAIKQYLQATNDAWKCNNSTDCSKANDSLGDFTDKISDEIINLYDIKKLILVSCENPGYDKINDISNDFKNYLETVKECEKKRYRFIAEFYNEETKKYSYAWVEYPILKGEGKS